MPNSAITALRFALDADSPPGVLLLAMLLVLLLLTIGAPLPLFRCLPGPGSPSQTEKEWPRILAETYAGPCSCLKGKHLRTDRERRRFYLSLALLQYECQDGI